MSNEKTIDITGGQYIHTVALVDSSGVPYIPGGGEPYVITQTTLAVTGTSQTLIAANAARKFLAWMIVGTQDVTISPATPVVAGVGLIYQASGAGKQGASEEFPNGAPSNAFYAIAATTGSTVIVWEGV